MYCIIYLRTKDTYVCTRIVSLMEHHSICLIYICCVCVTVLARGLRCTCIPIACRYLKEISKLRLTDTRICKATKHRIFSVAVHPTTSQLLVAAGDKWGGVGLWNLVSACRVYYSKKAFIVLLCDDCGNVPVCQGSSRN